MLHHLLVVTATNFFWLLFAFIGFGGWLLALRSKQRHVYSFTTFVQRAPVPVQILVFFALGCFFFVPFTLLAFALSLPSITAAMCYVALVAAALGATYEYRSSALQYLLDSWRQIRSVSAVAMVLFLTTLLGLIMLGGALGAFTADGTDSYVHTARIALIAHDSFTLDDSYFAGLTESRYHINVLFTMYVAAVKVLGITAFEAWRVSFATFLVLAYAAIFSIAWYFIPKKREAAWPYIIAPVSILITLMFWRTANYPNEVVLVWQSLYIIGLIEWVRRKGPVLLLLAASLVAFTQPTYALMTFAYTVVFIAAWMLFDRGSFKGVTKRSWAVALASLAILALPVAYSASFPNRMDNAYFNFMDAGSTTALKEVGPVRIMNPPLLTAHTPVFLALTTLAAIGYLWLFRHAENKSLKIAIGTLTVFYALLAYNPVFIKLFADITPPWMLQRFAYLNRVGSIAVAVGLLVLLYAILQKVTILKQELKVLVLALFALAAMIPAIRPQVSMVAATSAPSNHSLILTDDLAKLRPQLEGQQVFATVGNSFILPSIIPTSKVVFMPTMNAVPSADMTRRTKCAAKLTKSLDIQDLKRAGVTRILIGNWSGDLYPLATSKPYLKQIGSNATFTVMEVVYPSNMPEPKEGVCDIPQGA